MRTWLQQHPSYRFSINGNVDQSMGIIPAAYGTNKQTGSSTHSVGVFLIWLSCRSFYRQRRTNLDGHCSTHTWSCSMGAQPSPSSAWDDVGPRKDYRRHVKNSRRRQPLRALDGGAQNTDTPIVVAGGNLPSSCSNDVDCVVCISSDGATKTLVNGQVR